MNIVAIWVMGYFGGFDQQFETSGFCESVRGIGLPGPPGRFSLQVVLAEQVRQSVEDMALVARKRKLGEEWLGFVAALQAEIH